jgi:sigma-B regulation protein RsbU (phosphoserine phosphatase)
MPSTDPSLTQFIPAATLQRLMDSFASLTGHAAEIRDAQGRLLAESRPPAESSVDATLARTLAEQGDRLPPLIPIDAGEHRVGTILIRERAAEAVGAGAGVGYGEAGEGEGFTARQADAVQFMRLVADAIAQMCRQGLQLSHQVREMTTLTEVTRLLSGKRDLRSVLQTVARTVAQVMDVKAAAIRLLDESGETLSLAAVWNLSDEYLAKGPILLSRSVLDQEALAKGVEYVADMATDPRTLYPEDARREGLASILYAGMTYHGEPIGVMRIYTDQPRAFSDSEKSLLRAVAQASAGSIRSAKLYDGWQEQMRIQRQVELAADVQRRLLPARAPECPPFQVAGRCEPCYELGGDFFDFIPLVSSIGVVIGDVSGKGVAASLLMASVRASLRAHVQDVYDLDEVMKRVNAALTRDTRDDEFATVFYGTFDQRNRRLTYCSAGHDPALLLRGGQFIDLNTGGMVLGIDPQQAYEKGVIDLHEGDVLLMYTDGIPDAMNFSGEKFGRDRIRAAMIEAADQPAASIVNHVLWRVRGFTGLNHPPDDKTIVVVKVPRG